LKGGDLPPLTALSSIPFAPPKRGAIFLDVITSMSFFSLKGEYRNFLNVQKFVRAKKLKNPKT
jgi:hypothetical protein